jgi:medium-chain acyl-[acyl-carrier-protein] hydrolase
MSAGFDSSRYTAHFTQALERALRCKPAAILLGFPYAGASSRIFRDWREWLAPGIHVLPVELPGHGSLVRYAAAERMEDLVEALAASLTTLEGDVPLALFGHGLGALIGFELSRRLQVSCQPPPRHLFVSGQRAPQLPAILPKLHDLPTAQFVAELRARGGLTAADLGDDEPGGLLVSALRADHRLSEGYEYCPGEPLDVPITVFAGIEDPDCLPLDLEPWSALTKRSSVLRWLAGDQFYFHEHQRLVVANILRAMEIPSALETSYCSSFVSGLVA